ncbi:MAG: hypothetical protein CVV47_07610 [Spirochaetae bacterium HGW-Spirochaetae-3]|nr:MAG: hypothetical protein CVV47_07610 [Spirochaetae bacterium HGW-Spirochaetae-3]
MITVLSLAATVGASGDESWSLTPSAAVLALASDPAEPSPAALLDAALLFSGAGADRTEAAMSRGLAAIAVARGLAVSAADEYERGALVLELVHSTFSRYDLLESRLDRALLEGRYNCVASSTLYAILARAAGLTVRGVILEDHAYCYLLVGGRRVDVETTSAGGYAGATVGVGPEAETSVRGLVALALRNRATMLERSGRWFEALALAVDAYAYVRDDATMENLSGRISNCVAALLKNGRWSEAVGLAEAASASYGPSPVFERLEDTARIAAMTEALRAASPGGALAIAEASMADGSADAGWLERAFAYAYAGLAEESRKAGDQLGAWNVAAAGAARFPDSEPLASLERVAKGNWVKSVHNRFAGLYNAGRFKEALAAVRLALELSPGERMLESDAEAAEKALGSMPSP